MTITLRNLTKNDSQYFAKWWRDKELISLTSGNFEPLSDNDIKNQVKEMAQDTDSYHWLIQADSKIVGHINFNKLDNQKVELQIIIGEKEYWNKGIGKESVQKIIKKIKQLKFQKVYIEVRPTNSRAIHLYKKLGFKNLDLKKYPNNLNLPEVIMMEK